MRVGMMSSHVDTGVVSAYDDNVALSPYAYNPYQSPSGDKDQSSIGA